MDIGGVERCRGQDRGVSPVIAVILMVAITVILSAVIATFVLGIGQSVQETTPQATFSAEQSEIVVPEDDWGQGGSGQYWSTVTVVNITHQGGEEINQENIDVLVDGDQAFGWERASMNFQFGSNSPPLPLSATDPWHSGGTISAGDTFPVRLHGAGMGDVDATSNNLNIAWPNGPNEYNNIPEPTIYCTTGCASATERVNLQSGEVIQIVWTGSDTSTVLYEYEVKK